jgi:hypothetical protein
MWGYIPEIGFEEGLERTIAYFSLKNDVLFSAKT